MPTKTPALLTVGQIADRLDVSVHRIGYVVNSRGIEPIGRAGVLRVFDDAAVQRIASELRRMADREVPR